MHFNHYGGPGAELAAVLVNLAAGVAPPAQAVLLQPDIRQADLSPTELAGLRAWGERLAPMFGESDVDVRLPLLNRLLAQAVRRTYVSTHDGRPPHLHYAGEDDDPLTRVRAFTAGGVAHLFCGEPHRLGRCAACGLAYVDTSRNGRRRFCTNRCANRARVAEHRARVSTP